MVNGVLTPLQACPYMSNPRRARSPIEPRRYGSCRYRRGLSRALRAYGPPPPERRTAGRRKPQGCLKELGSAKLGDARRCPPAPTADWRTKMYLPNWFRPLGSMIGSSHLPPGDSGDGRLKDEEISRRGRQRVHNRYSLVPGRPSCRRPQLQRPPRTPWPPRHCGWTFPLAERPPRVAAPRYAISVPRWSRLRWATLRRLGPGRRFGGPGASRGDTAGAVCRAFDQRTCPRSEVLVSANTQP